MEIPAPRALGASASPAWENRRRSLVWSCFGASASTLPPHTGTEWRSPRPAGQAIALRGVSASVRSYGPELRHGKARTRSGGSAMGLFRALSGAWTAAGRQAAGAGGAGPAASQRAPLMPKGKRVRRRLGGANRGFGGRRSAGMANKPLNRGAAGEPSGAGWKAGAAVPSSQTYGGRYYGQVKCTTLTNPVCLTRLSCTPPSMDVPSGLTATVHATCISQVPSGRAVNTR